MRRGNLRARFLCSLGMTHGKLFVGQYTRVEVNPKSIVHILNVA